MRTTTVPRAMFRGLAPCLVLAALAAASALATPGGGYWPAVGGGKVSLRKSGLRPVALPANLRLAFDGAAGDPSGTGTLQLFDAAGQFLVEEFPFAWESRNGRSFRIDLDGASLEPWLAGALAAASGGEATATVAAATAKGRIVRRGEAARFTLRAVGEGSLAGGPVRPLRAVVKAR